MVKHISILHIFLSWATLARIELEDLENGDPSLAICVVRTKVPTLLNHECVRHIHPPYWTNDPSFHPKPPRPFEGLNAA